MADPKRTFRSFSSRHGCGHHFGLGEVVSDKNGESCYDLVDVNNPEILDLCYKVTSPCFQYRTCPIDYCALRNVTCPPLNQCYQQGTCDPDTAKCWWNAKPDGVVCDDGDESKREHTGFRHAQDSGVI